MDITICNQCGATFEGVRAFCPHCGSPNVAHQAELQPGEVIYMCGQCRATRRLGPKENPVVTQKQHGRIQKGEALQLPLTLWNTIFKCEQCKYWNWVTLDDRITGFEITCPDCGEVSAMDSLGKRLVLSKKLWEPVVVGELRLEHKPITLKCGHRLYLPTVLLENKAEPTATPAAAVPEPAKPVSEKKKTTPIPIVPPDKT